MKIVETSLNLRFEKGKEDYFLSKDISEKQLAFPDVDVYANVEFMVCNNDEYLSAFKKAGYNVHISVDENGRGILCLIKKEYKVTKIGEMADPHMQHLRLEKGNEYFDLITLRILVSNKTDADFKDRKNQFGRILSYIEKNVLDKTRLVLIGDFNHGVICDNVNGYKSTPRQFYNYQMIVEDLKNQNITLAEIEGYSFRGFMKIDHIATGEKIAVVSAEYKDVFNNTEVIGIPDHSCIVTNIEFK